jgi:sigma-54-interacting transcriptional regulator
MGVYLTRDSGPPIVAAFPMMNSNSVPRFSGSGQCPDPAEAAAWPLAAADLRALQQYRLNMMMVGRPSSTESVLVALEQILEKPVTFWQPAAHLTLPTAGGTLVLRNVSEMTPAEQSVVCAWLEHYRHRTQVISTSTRPLMPLLGRRVFSDVLYYRLNMLYLELPVE